jgi:hypothetical protein
MGKVVPLRGSKKIETVQNSDVESLLERDQWDRPLIMPPDHEPHPGCSPKKCGTAYRRASTVSEVLEDHFGLAAWKRRLTAEGLAKRPDLLQSYLTASTMKEKDAICEEAFIYAGGDASSRNGTTMHRLTEMLDRGQDVPANLPSHMVAMLEAYEAATARYEVLDTERFVVADQVKVGGTYDRRLRDKQTGEVFIGDLKTGKVDHLAVKAPAQVAVYAAGQHYSLDHERTPHGADRDRGILIHLKWTEDPNAAVCDLRWLDLRVGRKAILEAQRVERFRKLTVAQTMPHIKD